MGDRFFKAVLPVIDVADVDLQPGKPPRVIQPRKYFSGPFRGVERLVIFPEQDERLNGGAQSAGSLFPIAQRLV